jgi:hypothetical protein
MKNNILIILISYLVGYCFASFQLINCDYYLCYLEFFLVYVFHSFVMVIFYLLLFHFLIPKSKYSQFISSLSSFIFIGCFYLAPHIYHYNSSNITYNSYETIKFGHYFSYKVFLIKTAKTTFIPMVLYIIVLSLLKLKNKKKELN